MRSVLCICLMAVGISVCAVASQPIATVSGSSSFELDGSLINTAGVTTWPLMPGDRVVAKDSAVVIAMRDGSRITLAANSQIHFGSEANAIADLTSGSMQFTLAAGSNLRILRGGSPVVGRSGLVSPPSGVRPALLPPPPPPPAPPSPISSR
jgi:hypothetical protein